MRIPSLLVILTAILLAFVPATALAHLNHGNCPVGSQTLVAGPVHVDVYRIGCLGVTVSLPDGNCSVADLHPFSGVHVLILWTPDCQTGVIIEVLEDDEALLA